MGAIPDYQSIMLPYLRYLEDGKEHSSKDTIVYLANFFGLTEDQLQELLPSRQQTVFTNRVAWAKSYLKMAALIENTKRGISKITNSGLAVLEQNPNVIDRRFLMKIPAFVEYLSSGKGDSSENGNSEIELVTDKTPEEVLDTEYNSIRKSLAQEIITKIKACSPLFFENLVVTLLVKMGYGGSLKDAGKAIGRSGDEGIDGIIKEDKLGLDVIYIQAKRWEGNVGRPEIQKFVGALAGQGAKKGIFITTSRYTPDAVSYTPKNETKIVLIDGEQLAQLMIDYNLGVTNHITYEIKKIDSDFFESELF